MPPGVDFREYIAGVIANSDVLLAIIGPKWIGVRGAHHRLHDDADPVRVEIEAALQRKVPVIPVLVLNATMPRLNQLPMSMSEFAYRHAVRVDADQDFDIHMSRLVRALDRIFHGDGSEDKTAAQNMVEPELPRPASLVDPAFVDAAEAADQVREATPQVSETADIGKPLADTDADIIAAVERHLASFIGPVAGIAVRRALRRAKSMEELCRILSDHIDDPRERDSFLFRVAQRSPIPRPSPPTDQRAETAPVSPSAATSVPDRAAVFTPVALQQVEASLAYYIGPIARVVLRQQLSKSASWTELYSGLASYIPNEWDRTQFLTTRQV
jgi:hypothetical protein